MSTYHNQQGLMLSISFWLPIILTMIRVSTSENFLNVGGVFPILYNGQINLIGQLRQVRVWQAINNDDLNTRNLFLIFDKQ